MVHNQLPSNRQVILAGAEKVSVNSEAVKNPGVIKDGARAFGSQCIVLGMDVKKVLATREIPSGYEMVIHGGRTFTGLDALRWAKEAERLGAGEICVNSIDADGTSVLSGNVDLDVNGTPFKDVGRRQDIWLGRADSVYVPASAPVRVHANADGTEVAVGGGACAREDRK